MIAAGALNDTAQQAIDALRAAGFEHAHAAVFATDLTEVTAADNEASLLRSSETRKLLLQGIVDARMASTELADIAPDSIRAAAQTLFTDARSAPQDDASAVSSGQQARIEQGPLECDTQALVDSISSLLKFREEQTPRFTVRDSFARHVRHHFQVLTTGGSDLAGRMGWYELMAMGAGRDGNRASSLCYTAGDTHDLRGTPAPQLFGVADMMRSAEKSIDARPLGRKFQGDVVLMPNAVADLLGWLLAQLGDTQLIAGNSLYRNKVGERIASNAFTLRSAFDRPGVAAVSADGFAAHLVTVVDGGTLHKLLPTLYGSRKTGLAHVPTAPAGWEILPGEQPLAETIGAVKSGALVGRLSMGMPAANGNFSGVIKNSFAIDGGEVGHALAEVMITGNMAQMLNDIVAASRETREGSGWCLPWLRIAGLHFS